MDEIANLNEFFSGHLVANARRDTVHGGVVSYARMLLEGNLQVAKRLDLVHEGDKLRVVLSVEKVVFEHRKFARIGQGVVFAVLLLEEGVNLRCGEFMGITSLNLCDDGVAGFDALTLGLTDQVTTDDVLGHGHGARTRVERSEVQRP